MKYDVIIQLPIIVFDPRDAGVKYRPEGSLETVQGKQ